MIDVPERDTDVGDSARGAVSIARRGPGARGPARQHVVDADRAAVGSQRVSTAVDDEQRERLRVKLASRLDAEGKVRVVASEQRSQRQNRSAADERLAALVRHALIVPKKRRATKPTRAAKEKRLAEKKRRSERKRDRRVDDTP